MDGQRAQASRPRRRGRTGDGTVSDGVKALADSGSGLITLMEGLAYAAAQAAPPASPTPNEQKIVAAMTSRRGMPIGIPGTPSFADQRPSRCESAPSWAALEPELRRRGLN